MATMVNNGIYEIRPIHTQNSQRAINVLHYQYTNLGPGVYDESQFVAAFSLIYSDVIRPMMSVAARYDGAEIQRIVPGRGDAVFSEAGAGPGAVAGDAMSPFTAGRLKKRTGVAGKRARGRVYVPFPAEADNEGSGRPTQNYIDRLLDLAIVLSEVLQIDPADPGEALTPGVYSRVGLIFRPITIMLRVREWGTMRTRSYIRGGDRAV